MGDWHCYFYGSFENKAHEQVLWETQLEIDHKFSVKKTILKRGVMCGNLTVQENQSLITLFNTETRNSVYIRLNNRDIKDITIVTIFSKQYQRETDMMSIGIISREKLTKEDAKELLGSVNKLVLKVDPLLQDRVDDFVLKSCLV